MQYPCTNKNVQHCGTQTHGIKQKKGKSLQLVSKLNSGKSCSITRATLKAEAFVSYV